MSATNKLGLYIHDNGVDLADLSSRSGIAYNALQTSLLEGKRDLRADELMAICSTLEVNPMNFADFKEGEK